MPHKNGLPKRGQRTAKNKANKKRKKAVKKPNK